ncbi:MAG TPA: ABC transporter substrate-binding protein [Chloroflexota bacterium]|nr:ABC transporter substrate-binding protein [Chloroflexota bacterium]
MLHCWLLALATALALACTSAPRSPAGAVSSASPRPATSTAAAEPPAPRRTVQVGSLGVLSEAGLFLAAERGYFAAQGLAVEIVPFDSGARMVAALGSDQIQVGGGGLSAGLANAVLRGVPIKVVASQGRYEPGASPGYISVRRDLLESGHLRDYPDFRGRTLAIPSRASVNEFMAHRLAQKGGFSPEALNLVELNFSEMVTALGNGAADAGILADPLATIAAERGVAAKWRELVDLHPHLQVTVILFGPALATREPELGRRWLLAYLQGARDYHDAFFKGRDRDAAIAVLTRWTPVKDPALYERIGLATIDPNGEVDRPSLEHQLQWFADQGLLQGAITLDQLLDPSFARAAVEQLGRYE